MWMRLIDQQIFRKAERKALRHSPERIQFFADQIDRMIHFCERHGVPLIIGFLRSKNQQALLDHLRPDSWLASHPDGVGAGAFKLELVNFDASIRSIPEVDKHLSAAAYAVIAELFCRRIATSEQGGRCVPSGWIARRTLEPQPRLRARRVHERQQQDQIAEFDLEGLRNAQRARDDERRGGRR